MPRGYREWEHTVGANEKMALSSFITPCACISLSGTYARNHAGIAIFKYNFGGLGWPDFEINILILTIEPEAEFRNANLKMMSSRCMIRHRNLNSGRALVSHFGRPIFSSLDQKC